MSPVDVAAYIGAAAWLPQIAAWIWRRVVVSKVTIVAAPFVEIGFTRFGPIFNIRMAFSSERKDAIVDGVDVQLRHEDGEEHLLRWAGMSEHLSEITDASGNRQIVSREQAPIAVQIGQQGLLEKFVRFQEPRFWDRNQVPFEVFAKQALFLRAQGGEWWGRLLESRELHELLEAHRAAFWWKTGRWTAVFDLRSPGRLTVTRHSYEFVLSEANVSLLKENLSELSTEFQNVVRSAEPQYELRPTNWKWINASLQRTPS